MRVLLDTSVLVGALLRSHGRHEECAPWLEKARDGRVELVLAAHSLAELYAVLTTFPVKPRISPGTAQHLMQENGLETPPKGIAEIVALSPADYLSLLEEAAEDSLAGGIIYDKLITRSAEIADVETLVTMNVEHFRRAWPNGRDKIRQP